MEPIIARYHISQYHIVHNFWLPKMVIKKLCWLLSKWRHHYYIRAPWSCGLLFFYPCISTKPLLQCFFAHCFLAYFEKMIDQPGSRCAQNQCSFMKFAVLEIYVLFCWTEEVHDLIFRFNFFRKEIYPEKIRSVCDASKCKKLRCPQNRCFLLYI